MCIVWTPCVATGELLKWKVIVVVPGVYVTVFAGAPFTVKSVAWTVAGFIGSVTLTMKSVGCVDITLLQAGLVLVTEKPINSLSVKASCCDAALMATRPSVHDVTCLAAIAEP